MAEKQLRFHVGGRIVSVQKADGGAAVVTFDEIRSTEPQAVFTAAIRKFDEPDRSRWQFSLNAAQREQWKDGLRNVELLLIEAGASELPARFYVIGETLICELGPAGRVFSMALDQEGASISFRQDPNDFASYFSQSWDGLPSLQEFRQLLEQYGARKRYGWQPIAKRTAGKRWWITRSSDAAFATPMSTSEREMETEAFASC